MSDAAHRIVGSSLYYLAPVISLVIGLVGILAMGWDWREMIIFYWLSNITAGVVAVIDVIRSPAKVAQAPNSGFGLAGFAKKQYSVLFFCIHYGMFTAGHGLFVFLLAYGMFEAPRATAPVIPIAALLVSWVVLLVVTLIVKLTSAPPDKPVPTLINNPYKRILTLHLTIIAGAFVMIQFPNLPNTAALLLVALNALFEFIWAYQDRHATPKQLAVITVNGVPVGVDEVQASRTQTPPTAG